jgi:hypothetical protein
MKDEILQELAKLAAQKLHSDPSTLLDIFIGEELYVVEFYGYNSIYDAEVKSISWTDEQFADDEDLGYFDDLLEEQIYLHI